MNYQFFRSNHELIRDLREIGHAYVGEVDPQTRQCRMAPSERLVPDQWWGKDSEGPSRCSLSSFFRESAPFSVQPSRGPFTLRGMSGRGPLS
jgi:hypothetical protein